MDNYYALLTRAEELLPSVVFEEKKHWSSATDDKPKSYDVVVGGRRLGEVETTMRHGYRMSGRLITHHFKPAREWRYKDSAGNGPGRLSYTTRKEAVKNLLVNALRNGSIQ